jgi:hypothetical protein
MEPHAFQSICERASVTHENRSTNFDERLTMWQSEAWKTEGSTIPAHVIKPSLHEKEN